jgi:N-acetylgalactosamine-6-sulfatase
MTPVDRLLNRKLLSVVDMAAPISQDESEASSAAVSWTRDSVMRIKHYLRSIVVFILLFSSARAAERPPNIVFIYADDLGWGDLACHGHPHIQTPHLDRMAREGTDFHQFVVANPVCSPSRTAINTGQYPSRHGVHQHFASHQQNVARGMPDWLSTDAPSLPRLLKEAGYRTAHYGKWHLSGGGIKDAPLPSAYGYDDAAVHTGPGRNVFQGSNIGKPAKDEASFLSVAATDHAVRFIKESGDEPFFINLWLHETHHVVSATPEDRMPYGDVAEPQQTYYSAVTRMDRQVGRILDAVKNAGIDDRTLILFSSDNGPENSSPRLKYSVGVTGGMKGRKRSLYLGGVCTPFIVRWTGQVPTGRIDRETLLGGVDVLPTLLAAAGRELPSGYSPDGINALPALQGQPLQRTKPLFWYWQGSSGGPDWPRFGMRDGPWTLLMEDSNAELYQVQKDRGQQQNLAARFPERVASMKKSIAEWTATLPALPEIAPQASARKNTGSIKQRRTDRAAAFQRKDLNKDNQLTLEEYLDNFKNPEEVKDRFPRFDTNEDGVLSREEFVNPKGGTE